MGPMILVATWGGGLFALVGDECRQEIASQVVRGLAADGSGGALAIVGAHSLCGRAVNGEWETVATSEFELSCCVAVGDVIYVGTDDARMLRVAREGGALEVLESFDRVAGRETWFAGSAIVNGQRVGPPLGVRSVAANADGGVLFANVHVGGVPRSVDGGRTWEPTIEVNSDVHEVRAHPADPEMVVAASGVGLCVSRDAGATWSIEREGLHGLHCTAVAFVGEDVLVSAATDHFAAQGRVYRRAISVDGPMVPVEDEALGWTEGIVDTGCIAASGAVVAVVDRGGAVYVSRDFGRSWLRSGCRVPGASSVLIVEGR